MDASSPSSSSMTTTTGRDHSGTTNTMARFPPPLRQTRKDGAPRETGRGGRRCRRWPWHHFPHSLGRRRCHCRYCRRAAHSSSSQPSSIHHHDKVRGEGGARGAIFFLRTFVLRRTKQKASIFNVGTGLSNASEKRHRTPNGIPTGRGLQHNMMLCAQ